MSKFEKLYPENQREFDAPREKHPSIELSDKQHLEILNARIGYRPPNRQGMTPDLLEKFKISEKISKDTQVIDLNEKNKSKTAKKKSKKNNPNANKSAVAPV